MDQNAVVRLCVTICAVHPASAKVQYELRGHGLQHFHMRRHIEVPHTRLVAHTDTAPAPASADPAVQQLPERSEASQDHGCQALARAQVLHLDTPGTAARREDRTFAGQSERQPLVARSRPSVRVNLHPHWRRRALRRRALPRLIPAARAGQRHPRPPWWKILRIFRENKNQLLFCFVREHVPRHVKHHFTWEAVARSGRW